MVSLSGSGACERNAWAPSRPGSKVECPRLAAPANLLGLSPLLAGSLLSKLQLASDWWFILLFWGLDPGVGLLRCPYVYLRRVVLLVPRLSSCLGEFLSAIRKYQIVILIFPRLNCADTIIFNLQYLAFTIAIKNEPFDKSNLNSGYALCTSVHIHAPGLY